MKYFLLIFFVCFFAAGLLVSFVQYTNDKNTKKKVRFWSSERFLVFVAEIVIAVVGFGITLAVTNANERRVEQEQAAGMLQQVIEFTDRQISYESAYLKEYKDGKRTAESLRVSNIINLDYYNNILAVDSVLQNSNMQTYGNIMTYLKWIEQRDDLAREAEGDSVYTYMSQRHNQLKKLREFLVVCHEELTGQITAQEAFDRCHDIKYPAETAAATS